ncbi:hypothetical protein AWENTII_012245 [Aspergillus wentii]
MARHSKTKARIKRENVMVKAHTGPPLHKFTMQQEARNTEGRNLWSSGTNLRHKAVQFVSASDLQPEGAEDHVNQETSQGLHGQITASKKNNNDTNGTLDHEDNTENGVFSLDLPGESVTDTGLPDQVLQLPPAPQEESSEDEVVFLGRNKNTQHMPCGDEVTSSEMFMPSHYQRRRRSTNIQPEDDRNYIGLKQHSARKGKQRDLQEDENGILADYIANMDNDYQELYNPSDMDTESAAMEHSNSTSSTAGDITGICLKSNDLPVRNGRISPEQGSKELDLVSPDNLDVEVAVEAFGIPPNNSNNTPTSLSISSYMREIDNEESDIDSEEYPFDMKTDIEAIETLQGGVKGHSATQFLSSASSFADALELDPYRGFDIMDFDRPSIRNKSKGKQRAFDLMISDSELELELENAWQNDRTKKKAKKQKREELRSQGLLGRSKPDLKIKYSNGMSIDHFKSEIRIFLLSPKNSLSLPPMTKQLRKLVHDLANSLALKSQSRGKGSSRFPILYKTSRTPNYTTKTISQVDRTLSKGKFGYRTNQSSQKNSTKARRGRPDASVSYMDGDIVGASAPEIGAENKGRAMLEKMGWSMGTALGATNKGILLPVAHVVKNSKAGLG